MILSFYMFSSGALDTLMIRKPWHLETSGFPGQRCDLSWFRLPDTLLLRIDDDVRPVVLLSDPT